MVFPIGCYSLTFKVPLITCGFALILISLFPKVMGSCKTNLSDQILTQLQYYHIFDITAKDF